MKKYKIVKTCSFPGGHFVEGSPVTLSVELPDHLGELLVSTGNAELIAPAVSSAPAAGNEQPAVEHEPSPN